MGLEGDNFSALGKLLPSLSCQHLSMMAGGLGGKGGRESQGSYPAQLEWKQAHRSRLVNLLLWGSRR